MQRLDCVWSVPRRGDALLVFKGRNTMRMLDRAWSRLGKYGGNQYKGRTLGNRVDAPHEWLLETVSTDGVH